MSEVHWHHRASASRRRYFDHCTGGQTIGLAPRSVALEGSLAVKGERMDPQLTWERLLDAYQRREWSEVHELAESLSHWLSRGGFPPQTHGQFELDPNWNRVIAQAACRFALSAASQGGE